MTELVDEFVKFISKHKEKIANNDKFLCKISACHSELKLMINDIALEKIKKLIDDNKSDTLFLDKVTTHVEQISSKARHKNNTLTEAAIEWVALNPCVDRETVSDYYMKYIKSMKGECLSEYGFTVVMKNLKYDDVKHGSNFVWIRKDT